MAKVIVAYLFGLAVGLLVGLGGFFIPGVEDVVTGINADPANGKTIAWGLAQVLVLAELIGSLAGLTVGVLVALALGVKDEW